MDISVQFIFNILLSILGALIWFIVTNFKTKLSSLDKEIDSIKENFITRKEISAEIKSLQDVMNIHFKSLEKEIKNLENNLNIRFSLAEKLNEK